MINNIALAVSIKNRIHKFNLFTEQFNPSPTATILDVGPNDHEYDKNDNMLEKLYPYPSQITALGLWNFTEFNEKYPDIKTITYSGEEFPFGDKSFDFIWSNAVLEHVGNFNRQVNFIKEVARTADHAMITTPNRFFPFETHTKYFLLHFLPKAIFDKILVYTGKSWAAGDNLNLLSKRAIKKIFKNAGIKNYKIHHNRLFGFTIDYCIFF